MRTLKLLPLFVCICLVPAAAIAQQVGDVVVVLQGTPLKVGDQVLQTLDRGLAVRVEAVSGDWLWVSHKATGWVQKRHVTLPSYAVDIFSEQIQRNPQDSGAYLARGMAWVAKGDADRAIGDFTESIRVNPNESAVYGSRGMCWLEKEDYNKAIADFSEAVRLNPQDAIDYGNRGYAWYKKSEFDKAILDLTEAIRLAPTYSRAYYNRGLAYKGKQQFDKAIADFNEAIRINPKDIDAYSSLAWLCATCPDAQFRNGETAVKNATKACELTAWKMDYALGALAAAYAEVGNFDEAVKWQTKAQELYSRKDRAEWGHLLDLYKSGKSFREEPKN